MGLFDGLKGAVVVEYKVEVEHAKQKIRELSGEQKKQAAESVAAMERQTRSAELMAAKMTAGIGLIVGGYALAKKGVEAYEKSLQQAGESGSASLARLKAATAQTDKAINDIEISLGKVVVAAAPVIQMFADMASGLGAIAQGIGLVVEQASNLPGAGVAGKIWKYGKYVPNPVTGVLGTASGIASFADYELDTGGVPGADLLDALRRAGGRPSFEGNGYVPFNSSAGYSNTLEYKLLQQRALRESQGRMVLNNLLAKGEGFLGGIGGGLGFTSDGKKGGRGGGGYEGPGLLARLRLQLEQQQRNDEYLLLTAGDTVAGEKFGTFADFDKGPSKGDQTLSALRDAFKQLQSVGGVDMAKIRKERQDTLLTQIFGTPVEINAQAEALQLAGQAVEGLSGASAAAMQAWITGEQSAGKAALLAIGNTVGGLAGEMAARSTKELIEAGVALFMGRPDVAGRHAAAGALYGSGALALGAAAREIHPSAQVKGKGGGHSSSAGLGSGRGGGGGGGEGRTFNLHIGDSLGWESPRTQAIKFRQLERLAQNRLPAPAGVGD